MSAPRRELGAVWATVRERMKNLGLGRGSLRPGIHGCRSGARLPSTTAGEVLESPKANENRLVQTSLFYRVETEAQEGKGLGRDPQGARGKAGPERALLSPWALGLGLGGRG